MTLHPVILAVASDAPHRTPERIQAQREAARKALRESARLSGAPEAGWQQDASRVPLANQGFHWSISHKREWVAAVVSREPVGIDVEHVIPKKEALYAELATAEEWRLLGERDWPAFFRVWTAKEAVLKANGVGIAQLLNCHVVKLMSAYNMTVHYKEDDWTVEQFFRDDHVFAVATNGHTIDWQVFS